MYITPRTLLGIIRLAQAMSKLAFRDTVNQDDVDEALKLMDFSIQTLRTMKNDKGANERASKSYVFHNTYIGKEHVTNDKMSDVMKAVKEVMTYNNAPSMNVNEILKKIKSTHLASLKLEKPDLMEALNYYKKLQIIYVDEDDNVIFL